MTNSPKTRAVLDGIVDMISRSGRPDEEFFYLGGPMTKIPSFNFPRFHYVADKLRANGLNIVSPAELDDPATAAQSMASPDGLDHDLHSANEGGLRLIARDLIVVELPTCVGGIFLEGWHRSSGATKETWVLSRLKKPLFEYDDGAGILDTYELTEIDRDSRIDELNAIDDILKSIKESATQPKDINRFPGGKMHHHRPLDGPSTAKRPEPPAPGWLRPLTDPFGDRK